MRTFFLDLASHNGLLACVDDHAVVASQAIDHRIADHELIPLFGQTLGAAGWKSGDLTRIACVVGPGGFTSLRVAVAFTNALAHELKIPAAGIHLSDLYAARAEAGLPAQNSKLKTQNFVWLHSTKKHELFIRGFGELSKDWPNPVLISLDALKTHHWTGELIPEHEALVREKGMIPLALKPIEEIFPGFLASQVFSPKLLEPWYGRGG